MKSHTKQYLHQSSDLAGDPVVTALRDLILNKSGHFTHGTATLS